MPTYVKLLSFPDRVLRLILRDFESQWLFEFSLFSKKARDAVRTTVAGMKPARIKVEFGEESTVIANYKLGYFRVIANRKIRDVERMESTNKTQMIGGVNFWSNRELERFPSDYRTFWDDTTVGALKIAEHLQYIFEAETGQVIMSEPTHNAAMKKRQFYEIVDWLFPNVSFYFSCSEDDRSYNDKLLYLLEKVTSLRSFQILTSFNIFKGVEFDFSEKRFEHFHVTSANWLTLRNVFQLKFSTLRAGSTSFTAEDINQILRKWLHGWNSELRMLVVDQKEYFTRKIMEKCVEGLNAKWVNGLKNFQNFDIREEKYEQIVIKEGFELRREDTAVARICFEGGASCEVSIYVWPRI